MTSAAPHPTAARPGTGPARTEGAVWADPGRPLDERVARLLADMTLDEKLAQLGGLWVGLSLDGGDVAPAQQEFADDVPSWADATRHGLGHLTRVFGTSPVDPADGARILARTQEDLVTGSRLGIPAIAHEECLTGFTAWRATVFPTPLAWGAAFDPGTVEAMAGAIASSMRDVGVHQGLSPVADVVRDYRWGRTEESVGEDPYLVGSTVAAYVRGLEAAGIVATLKHFAGYSASDSGRNHAPVAMGPRQFADVMLPPFEMGLRLGGARSVMHSYADVDGVPPAADPRLLTDLLRETWGFRGVVVADYFGVSFLETMHGVAADPGEAAALAITAGVDVELPTARCYGAPLAALVRSGRVPEGLVDRAVTRVLRQKGELGLLDAGWRPAAGRLPDSDVVDLDPPVLRDLARTLAERSVVLLDNARAALPAASPRRVAVVGPCADEVLSLLGCYAFPNHVGVQHPDVPLGIEVPTVLDALRAEWPGADLQHDRGCDVSGPDASGIGPARDMAAAADLCVAVLGDVAGLFGRGTSGEGCDADDLSLPGVQADLLDALVVTGTPVVLVLLTGRPYALGRWDGRLAAAVQAFFPGQEGARAVAGVLSGRINPSGHLPVQIPRSAGGQPSTYHGPRLNRANGVSTADPSPLHPFGHGLSYTTFEYGDLTLSSPGLPVAGEVVAEVTVTNAGQRDGADVVQLYASDRVASVTRPVRELIGFARVELPAGGAARVRFAVHADRLSFTGRDLRRVVEPGTVELAVGASSEDLRARATLEVVGEVRAVGPDRVLTTPVEVLRQ